MRSYIFFQNTIWINDTKQGLIERVDKISETMLECAINEVIHNVPLSRAPEVISEHIFDLLRNKNNKFQRLIMPEDDGIKEKADE